MVNELDTCIGKIEKAHPKDGPLSPLVGLNNKTHLWDLNKKENYGTDEEI